MTPVSEQLPPWRVFPDMQPEQLGATQGAQEAWLDTVWRPQWASLSAEERKHSLMRWHASPSWREWIAFVCEPAVDFDAASDAAESEAMLEARAKSDARGLSLLQRLRKARRGH